MNLVVVSSRNDIPVFIPSRDASIFVKVFGNSLDLMLRDMRCLVIVLLDNGWVWAGVGGAVGTCVRRCCIKFSSLRGQHVWDVCHKAKDFKVSIVFDNKPQRPDKNDRLGPKQQPGVYLANYQI